MVFIASAAGRTSGARGCTTRVKQSLWPSTGSAHLLADSGVAGVSGDTGVAGESGEEDIARLQEQTGLEEKSTGVDARDR